MAEAEAYASQPRDAAAGIYTETLARLYLKQGFGERALAIYQRLAQEQPDNHQLHERLRTFNRSWHAEGVGQTLRCKGLPLTGQVREPRR